MIAVFKILQKKNLKNLDIRSAPDSRRFLQLRYHNPLEMPAAV